jgi:hypothetical protein
VIAITAPSPHGRANRRHIVAMGAHLSAVVAKVIDAASRSAKNGSPARDPAHDRAEGLPLACAHPRAVSGVDRL